MQHTIIIGNRNRHRFSGNRSALTVAFFHLSHLLRAGVGLGDALTDLCEIESGFQMRRVWRDIAQRVNEGQSLSDAFRDWPALFDSTVVALIKAGESSGELADASHNCMRLLQWQEQLKARMANALVYPLFALVLLTGVVGFLMVNIVPSMGSFLAANATGTAWHTKGLLFTSQWLSTHGLSALVVVMLLVGVLVSIRHMSAAFRQLTDGYLLYLPIAGKVISDLSLSRYGTTCARLYGSGVSLGEAMELSEGVVSNRALRQSLGNARRKMLAGSSLSNALECVPHLPGVFKRLLGAGESAGALQSALQQASEQQLQQTDHTMARAEKLIGPVMLMVVGAAVLWVVMSLLGPVYQSAIETVMQS